MANPNEIKCDWCDPDNQPDDAISYCLNCKEFYCAECQQSHSRAKATRDHNCVSVEDGWKLVSGSSSSSLDQNHEIEQISFRSSHCLKHPNQEINTFCKKDQEPVCLQCAVQFHNGHTFDQLENMIPQFRAEIEPKLIEVFLFFV